MCANCINILSDINESQAVVNLNKKHLQSITQSSSDIKTSKELSYFFFVHFSRTFHKHVSKIHWKSPWLPHSLPSASLSSSAWRIHWFLMNILVLFLADRLSFPVCMKCFGRSTWALSSFQSIYTTLKRLTQNQLNRLHVPVCCLFINYPQNLTHLLQLGY